jgi:hypothetical protein
MRLTLKKYKSKDNNPLNPIKKLWYYFPIQIKNNERWGIT